MQSTGHAAKQSPIASQTSETIVNALISMAISPGRRVLPVFY